MREFGNSIHFHRCPYNSVLAIHTITSALLQIMDYNFYVLWVWLLIVPFNIFVPEIKPSNWHFLLSHCRIITLQDKLQRQRDWCVLGNIGSLELCLSGPLFLSCLPLHLWTPVSALFCRWLPCCQLLHLFLLLLGPPSPETGWGTPTWNMHKTKIKDPISLF